MANKHLATYLNDHLAGATIGVEILSSLEAVHPDTERARVFAELRAEVEEDRQALKALMDRLNITESAPRKVAGWLAAQLTQLKLHLDDPAGEELRVFEGLEGMSLGIEGKRSLWVALAAVAEQSPELQGVDYDSLRQRAVEQRKRVEALRLEAAKAALGPESSTD
jgi:hypothetical protein